jgi:hypothetical protein
VYSPTIYSVLIHDRIEELRRAAVESRGTGGGETGKARHWTAALAAYLKPSIPAPTGEAQPR